VKTRVEASAAPAHHETDRILLSPRKKPSQKKTFRLALRARYIR
jgi:hypothetical protein